MNDDKVKVGSKLLKIIIVCNLKCLFTMHIKRSFVQHTNGYISHETVGYLDVVGKISVLLLR